MDYFIGIGGAILLTVLGTYMWSTVLLWVRVWKSKSFRNHLRELLDPYSDDDEEENP